MAAQGKKRSASRKPAKKPVRKPARKAARPAAKKAAKRPARQPAKKTAARKPPAPPLPEPDELESDEPRPRAGHRDLAFPVDRVGPEDLAEVMGEDYLRSATGGEEPAEEHDQEEEEERGGPFVETGANKELAHDTDESNPEDALAEPFPIANAEPEELGAADESE